VPIAIDFVAIGVLEDGNSVEVAVGVKMGIAVGVLAGTGATNVDVAEEITNPDEQIKTGKSTDIRIAPAEIVFLRQYSVNFAKVNLLPDVFFLIVDGDGSSISLNEAIQSISVFPSTKPKFRTLRIE